MDNVVAPPSYDFFISYTSKDQAWAEWIAWQLEVAGYTTVIQAWDFKSGGVFPADMHHALEHSTRVLAVLSQDYMKSDFCTVEWLSAFKSDPLGNSGRLVLIRIAESMKTNDNGLTEACGVLIYVKSGITGDKPGDIRQ